MWIHSLNRSDWNMNISNTMLKLKNVDTDTHIVRKVTSHILFFRRTLNVFDNSNIQILEFAISLLEPNLGGVIENSISFSKALKRPNFQLFKSQSGFSKYIQREKGKIGRWISKDIFS